MPGTLSISGTLGSRVVCSFQLVETKPFTMDYDIGSAVEVKNADDVIIFGGTIDTNPEVIDNAGARRVFSIQCVDYSQIADRHLAAYAYEGYGTHDYIPTDASANNWWSTSGPWNAIDQNLNSEMLLLGATGGDWFSVDLGAEHLIDAMYMYYKDDQSTPKEFKVQYSDDNSTWVDIDSFDLGPSSWAEFAYTKVEFTPTSARYFRILVQVFNSGVWRMYDVYLSGDTLWTAGTIVKDVISRFFAYGDASENIDVSNVADGPVIDKAVFNYIPCSQVFSELADIAGFVWYIDYDKKMYFYDSSANAAPFSLTSTSSNWRNMRISKSRDQYRNKQVIRGGNSLTEEREDSITAIAAQKLFEFPFPVGTASDVSENSVPKTLGVKGFDEGKDYYWSYNSPIVEAAVAPGAGVVVKLTYQGLFPILITEVLSDEILARRAIEGGTGVYESIIDDTSITAQTAGVQIALAYLRKYGTIPKTINFETDSAGLRAGQLLTVDVPELGLDDNFLIESVSIKDYGGVINRYQVSAVSGEALGGWLDFFNSLSRQTQNLRLYDEDQVVILETTADTVELTDDATLFSTGKPDSYTNIAVSNFSETNFA